MIDDKGNEFVSVIYSEINKYGDYRDDWALVKIGDRIGFINKIGEEIVPLKYYSIDKFNDGRAKVHLGNKEGFINEKGTEIVKLLYNSIEKYNDYQEGWAKVRVGLHYGFITETGEEIVNLFTMLSNLLINTGKGGLK